MLEKPAIEDGQIIVCLKRNYDLTVTSVEFLPRGYDANAGVYRIGANGQHYFLKVKRDAVDELSVYLPHYLKSQGMQQVVAPLPTITQALWGRVEPFTLILYPFIEGKSGWDAGLSDEQWVAFGVILKQLHSMTLSPDLLKRVPKETFVVHPRWLTLFDQLCAAVRNRASENPYERQLAAFWGDHQHEIDHIVERTAQLSGILQDRPSALVLCHADIHTANLLIDTQDRLFVVDWDQPVLAPRERDLMFVTVGGFVTEKRAETLFFQGYGKADVDPLTMAYYRYERLMEDLLEFAAQVLLRDTNDETRQDSLKWFIAQFAPDGPLQASHELDRKLNEAVWKSS
jgi:spectinomycin phosphotransferase